MVLLLLLVCCCCRCRCCCCRCCCCWSFCKSLDCSLVQAIKQSLSLSLSLSIYVYLSSLIMHASHSHGNFYFIFYFIRLHASHSHVIFLSFLRLFVRAWTIHLSRQEGSNACSFWRSKIKYTNQPTNYDFSGVVSNCRLHSSTSPH